MNKAQKIIVLIALLMILICLVYPPYLEMAFAFGKEGIIGAGLDWIFNSFGKKLEEKNTNGDSLSFTVWRKIRFDVLLCEILAVGIIATIFVLIVKKNRKKKEVNHENLSKR